ncbi:MAG: hypothetical protein U0528_04945 [Anaerolineae bacterium]
MIQQANELSAALIRRANQHEVEDAAIVAKTYDLLNMGRSGIDLYSNDVGAPFVNITSFAAYVGGSCNQYLRGRNAARTQDRTADGGG